MMEDNYESLSLTNANSNSGTDDETTQSNTEVTRLADFLSSALEPTKDDEAEIETPSEPKLQSLSVESTKEEALAENTQTPAKDKEVESPTSNTSRPNPPQIMPPSASKTALAAILKKRIEDKQNTSASAPPKASPTTKKSKGRPKKNAVVADKSASPASSEEPSGPSPTSGEKVITRSSIGTYTPKKVFDPSNGTEEPVVSSPSPSPTVTPKKRGRKKSVPQPVQNAEDNLDYVEGFQILAADSPPRDVGSYDPQDENYEPDYHLSRSYSVNNNNNNNVAANASPALLENLKLFGSKPRVGKGTARLKASSGASFGPGVLKKAIRVMGGRATGNQIADWVIENRPDFLELFGDRKKLRYSIIGILSAKSYTTIFGKEVVIRNGVKRNEWFILGKGAEEDDDKDDPILEEEAVSGLFGLYKAASSPNSGTVEAKPENIPSVYDYKFCSICNKGDNDDQLLLCDYCDNGFHMYCLDPPLTDIPEGTWYCNPCQLKVQTEGLLPNNTTTTTTTSTKKSLSSHHEDREHEHEHGLSDLASEQDEVMTLPDEDADMDMEMGYMEYDDSHLEDDMPLEIDPSLRGKDEEYILLNTRTCEKHRRWKKKCPPDCPMRIKLGSARDRKLHKLYYREPLHNPFSHKTRVLRTLKPIQKKLKAKSEDMDDFIEDDDSKGGKLKRMRAAKSENDMEGGGLYSDSTSLPTEMRVLERTPTYIEMIEEAISTLGGKATTPAITNFMEEHHGQLLSTKTKTWRNSVSGCLSTHFERADLKDGHGRTLWTIPTNKGEKRERKSKFEKDLLFQMQQQQYLASAEDRLLRLKSEDDLRSGVKPTATTTSTSSTNGNASAPKLRAPGRTTSKPKRLFDPEHLENLKKTNSNFNDNYWKNYQGIEYINSSHCLSLSSTKLQHPGPVYSISWSNDYSMLVSANTNGSVRIWDISDWKLLKELKDSSEQNIEEYYDAIFTSSDKYIAVVGRIKDRGTWNEDTNDNQVISGCVKIYDIISAKVILNLSTNFTEDVLCIRSVVFDNVNYLIVCSQDGSIVKYKLSDDFSKVLDTRKLSNSGTGMAVTLEFVPDCGNKYFVAAFDSGLKVFDFEGEMLVQSFSNLYTYLCDCIRFVKCKDIKGNKNEQYLITKGVELINEDNEVVKANSCHLRKLVFPDNGMGAITLEEVTSYENEYYKSNVWLMKCNSNGRYMCSPTTDGRVFVWNLKSREVAAILFDHTKGVEVRDVLFHPTKKLFLTAGDDYTIRIYTQPESTTTTPTNDNSVTTPIVAATASPKKEDTEQEKSKRKGRPKKIVRKRTLGSAEDEMEVDIENSDQELKKEQTETKVEEEEKDAEEEYHKRKHEEEEEEEEEDSLSNEDAPPTKAAKKGGKLKD